MRYRFVGDVRVGRYKAGVHKDIKDEGKINRERQIDYIHSHYNKER